MSVTLATQGNLTADPEIRHTPNGAAVASFRIACSDRYQDKNGEWVDSEPTYLSVTCWRALAQNVAESLHKGDTVVVIGSLQGRSYETETGDKRTVNEVTATHVGASLAYATATMTRNPRRGGE